MDWKACNRYLQKLQKTFQQCMQKSHFIKSEKFCLYPELKHESKGNGQRKSTTVRKQNSWCLWEAHVHVMGTNIRDIFMMKLSDRSSSPSSASLNNCTRTTWQQQKKSHRYQNTDDCFLGAWGLGNGSGMNVWAASAVNSGNVLECLDMGPWLVIPALL